MSETITPGVARTVALLQSWGFDTTDSGDGVTNVEAGMECAMPFPNVAMQVEPDELIAKADRLLRLLWQVGIQAMPASYDVTMPSIQATYDPSNQSAILVLTGVDDAMLPEAR